MKWMAAAAMVAGLLVMGACGGDDGSSGPEEVLEESEVVALRAKDMRGKVEVPPGDRNGKGFVGLDIDLGGEVCIEYRSEGIDEPIAMHVHEGKAGTAGDPVIDLPLDGGCVEAEPDLLEAIADDPASYYANIHTKKYPDGAIRAQLSSAK